MSRRWIGTIYQGGLKIYPGKYLGRIQITPNLGLWVQSKRPFLLVAKSWVDFCNLLEADSAFYPNSHRNYQALPPETEIPSPAAPHLLIWTCPEQRT